MTENTMMNDKDDSVPWHNQTSRPGSLDTKNFIIYFLNPMTFYTW